MQKMEWFWVVRGHLRSTAMSSFDRAHTTSYSTLIETMRLSCTVFEIQLAICRKSPILIHPPAFGAPQGVTPVEFRGDLWLSKTRVPRLSCDVVYVILRLAVLVGLRLVTDGRTQGHGQYRGYIASRGKKLENVDGATSAFIVRQGLNRPKARVLLYDAASQNANASYTQA